MKMTYKKILLLTAIFSVLGLSLQAETPEGWVDDYAEAKEAGKPMLLMFTGSDWCGWCIRAHKEILDTETFMDWAKENITLVYLDFPRKEYRSEAQQKQNDALNEKFGIRGYPTMVILDDSGKELGRTGYMQGGPKTFIRELKRIIE